MATIQEISEQIKQAGIPLGVNEITDVMPGGVADDIPADKFNPEALAKGIKHELEHTKDEKIASEIARDHLAEDPEYYDKLEAMKLRGVDLETYRLMACK